MDQDAFASLEDDDELERSAVLYLQHQLDLPLQQPDGSPTFFYRPQSPLEFVVDKRAFAAAVIAVGLRSTDEVSLSKKSGTRVVKRSARCWLTVMDQGLRITTEWDGVSCETSLQLVSARHFTAFARVSLELNYPALRRTMELLVSQRHDSFQRFPADGRRHRDMLHFAFLEPGTLELVLRQGTKLYFDAEALIAPLMPLRSGPLMLDQAPIDPLKLRDALRTVKVAAKTSVPGDDLIAVHNNSASAMSSSLAAHVEYKGLVSETMGIPLSAANILPAVLRRMSGSILSCFDGSAILDDLVLTVKFPTERVGFPEQMPPSVPHDATYGCQVNHSDIAHGLAMVGLVDTQRPKRMLYALIGDVMTAIRDGALQWTLDFLDEVNLRWLPRFTGSQLLLATNAGRGNALVMVPVNPLRDLLPPETLAVGSVSLAELSKVSTVLQNGVQQLFLCPNRIIIRDPRPESTAVFALPSKRIE